jgi:hypothetical protein
MDPTAGLHCLAEAKESSAWAGTQTPRSPSSQPAAIPTALPRHFNTRIMHYQCETFVANNSSGLLQSSNLMIVGMPP